MNRLEAARRALELRDKFAAMLEEARPGATFETLPACAHCGAPSAPNTIGGVLCLSRAGELVDPHAVRVRAFRSMLPTPATPADNLCDAVREAGYGIACSRCGDMIPTGDIRDHLCPDERPS